MGNATTGCGLGSTAAQVDAGSTRGGSSSTRSPKKTSSTSSWSKSRNASSDLVPWVPNQRWRMTVGKKQLMITDSRGGRVGLSNLGNTCFMNAGLQCLSHLEPVNSYFLSGMYEQEINDKNPLGNGGQLARAFAKLQEEIWQKSANMHRPKSLHSTLTRFAPHLFEGFEQQDTQEFLAYLLDGLHEDLNLVKERPQAAKGNTTEEEELKADEEMEQIEQEQGEEYVAAMAWLRHLTRHKSILVDLFQGQFRSIVTCTRCGKVSKTFDPYLYMSLPVNDGMRSIEDALQAFLAEETLSGNEQWRCNRCKQRVDATKKIDIWKLPPVLVLHLKRFEFDTRTFRFQKIQAALDSPLTIDLSEWVKSEQKEPLVYDITCVANHSGAFGSGHYTAMCRHPVDGKWYNFNDDHVEEVPDPERSVMSNRAYVLFLIRNVDGNSDVEGMEVFRQSVSHPEVWPHTVSKTNSIMLAAVRDVVQQTNNFQPKKSGGGKLSASKGLKSLLGGRRALPAMRDVPVVEEAEGDEPTL
mmetsp:Transcript_49180/g.77747  ORF Transcript_49180/g.77747 Transcript_49180/m.77747 type:complete len:524 (+) Transcript_49180:143-1714(+)